MDSAADRWPRNVPFRFGRKFKNQPLGAIPGDYLRTSLGWSLPDALMIAVQAEDARRRGDLETFRSLEEWHHTGSRARHGRRERVRDRAHRLRQIQRLADSLRRQGVHAQTPLADRPWFLATADVLEEALQRSRNFDSQPAAPAGQQRGTIPNDLAALAGRRFVIASETNDGSRFNEARIKMLTGSDPVTARFLYGELFQFVPTANATHRYARARATTPSERQWAARMLDALRAAMVAANVTSSSSTPGDRS